MRPLGQSPAVQMAEDDFINMCEVQFPSWQLDTKTSLMTPLSLLSAERTFQDFLCKLPVIPESWREFQMENSMILSVLSGAP